MEFYSPKSSYLDIHLPSETGMLASEWEAVDHLSERTKELKCLYGIFKILGQYDLPLDRMLQKVVNLVPIGWKFSEIAYARIDIEGAIYLSKPFLPGKWILSENICVDKRKVGTLDILYAENRLGFFKGPFLKDEVFLLEAISKMIGQAIEKKAFEEEKVRLCREIQDAYEKILRGIIPICASCKSIRDEKGIWHQLEVYVQARTKAKFSHGVCPACKKKLYPSIALC